MDEFITFIEWFFKIILISVIFTVIFVFGSNLLTKKDDTVFSEEESKYDKSLFDGTYVLNDDANITITYEEEIDGYTINFHSRDYDEEDVFDKDGEYSFTEFRYEGEKTHKFTKLVFLEVKDSTYRVVDESGVVRYFFLTDKTGNKIYVCREGQWPYDTFVKDRY